MAECQRSGCSFEYEGADALKAGSDHALAFGHTVVIEGV